MNLKTAWEKVKNNWIVILIVFFLAGLIMHYYGILSPSTGRLLKCSFPAGLTCGNDEFYITKDSIGLTMYNYFPEDIIIKKIFISERSHPSQQFCEYGLTEVTPPVVLQPNRKLQLIDKKHQFILKCEASASLQEGKKYSYDLNVTYVYPAGGSAERDLFGELYGRVNPSS